VSAPDWFEELRKNAVPFERRTYRCCGKCSGKTDGWACTCVSDAFIAERHGERWCCETTPRQSVLDEAGRLIHSDRNVAYGPPMKNFERIAALWSVYLKDHPPGEPLQPYQVADMNILQKVARSMEAPKRDNYTDIAGYAACGWECAETDCE
jgi:hypothetical protein